MSEDQNSWSNRFKLKQSWYKDSDWRQAKISTDHFIGEVDNPDTPVENSALSNHGRARIYSSPYDTFPYPRECRKHVSRYYGCRMELGVVSPVDPSPLQCNDIKAKVFEECPRWVLQNIAFKKKFIERTEMIDNLTYQRAMEVSDYNK